MSGPKTNSYTLSRIQQEETRRRREKERRRLEAELLRQRELKSEIAALEGRLEQLRAEADQGRQEFPDYVSVTVTVPSQPRNTSIDSLERHVAALSRQLSSLATALKGQIETGRTNRDAAKAFAGIKSSMAGKVRTVAEVMGTPTVARGEHRPAMKRLEESLAVLSSEERFSFLAEENQLVDELRDSRLSSRTDLLLSELALRIARFREREAQRRADSAESIRLLASLGKPENAAEEALTLELESVVDGGQPLSEATRLAVSGVLSARDANDEGREAASIARKALEEIGFQVGEEFGTLFLEGGMVHFQRPGWGDYYIRMRVSPSQQTMNFNVVRAGEPGAADSREQSLRDAEMEREWCGLYRQLMADLNHRGIENQQIRHMEPGAAPVQVVAPEAVGHREENARKSKITPQAKVRSLT